ncbi:hypothetical protein VM1G_02302 [Cytospora mali]|uniref:Uncharacterized protein n=1 Tax=Cytospora mali TaxID=578113 RepID=A0A194VS25_CYTMA|nr:hypothetical protein VM1G_02302 [Valsa mali]
MGSNSDSAQTALVVFGVFLSSGLGCASRLCLQVRGHGFVLLAEDAMLVVLNIFRLERLARVDLQDPQDLQVYRAYKASEAFKAFKANETRASFERCSNITSDQVYYVTLCARLSTMIPMLTISGVTCIYQDSKPFARSAGPVTLW